MTTLWTEILNRRLFRISAAYMVIAWIVMQVASLLFPVFAVPEWGLRLFVLLTILGLPVVLIAAHLMRGTAPDTQPPPKRTHAVDILLIGVIAVMTGVAGYQLVRIVPEIEAGIAPSPGDAAGITRAGLPPLQALDNSIAVLPFASFSSNEQDGYFADGLTEEVINSLARIDGLRVVGRTSSFYFKDRNLDIREIASDLNVLYVIEGSVRRAGEQLRITAQLVEADSGFHLWSDTFDRTDSDLFEVQEAIARQVARVLEVAILADAAPDRPAGSANPDAQRLYLIGLARLRARTMDDIEAAVGLFEDAIALDPEFALAHAHLAAAHLLLGDHKGMPGDKADEGQRAEARVLIDRALALDPDSSTAHSVEGLYLLEPLMDGLISDEDEAGRQRDAAETALQRALALDPRNVEAHLWYGLLLLTVDDAPLPALQQFRMVMDIDPLFLRGLQNAAGALTRLGRYDEARQLYRQLVNAFGSNPEVYAQMSRFQEAIGRVDNAILWQRKALNQGVHVLEHLRLATLYGDLDALDKARAALEGMRDTPLDAFIGIFDALLAEDLDRFAEVTADRSGLPDWSDDIISDWYVSMTLGNWDKALTDLERSRPALFTELAPDVRRATNGPQALAVAYLWRRMGDDAAAGRLLDLVEAAYTPQRGQADHFCFKAIRSAILAMRGERDEAAALFAEAVDNGLLSQIRPLCTALPAPAEDHPYLETIRTHPVFVAAVAQMSQSAATQRDRVRQYEARTAEDQPEAAAPPD